MLKRFTLLFLCLIFNFSITGCGKYSKDKRKEEFGEIAPKKVENQEDYSMYKFLNKTYYVDRDGIKGKLYIGIPTEEFRKNAEDKEYVEINLPVTLTNSGNPILAEELLKEIKVSDKFRPYKDKLELRYKKTGDIIKGNSENGSEDYFMKILNTNNGKSNKEIKMENSESRFTYYKFLIYPDYIGLKDSDEFKNIKIDSFEFVVPNSNGNGYNILK